MRPQADRDRPEHNDQVATIRTVGDDAVEVINQRWVKAVIAYGGRVLLLRQSEGAHAGTWALPGAQMRASETVADALARTVAVQTGLNTSGGIQMHSGRWSPVVRRAVRLITASFHFCPIDPAAVRDGGAPDAVPGAGHDQYAWITLCDLSVFETVEPDRSAVVAFFLNFDAGNATAAAPALPT